MIDREALINALHEQIDGDFLVAASRWTPGEDVAITKASVTEVVHWAADAVVPLLAGVSAPKRIRRRRTAGWRMPEGAVYVGRPTEWGNPWIVGDVIGLEWPDPGVLDGRQRFFREMVITPELAVALYRIAFTPDAEEIRAQFAGRDLVCWCPLDQPCHADVLLELANQEA